MNKVEQTKPTLHVNLLFDMFEEHYKDGSFAGEATRNWRLIGVRLGIIGAIVVISLIAVGYTKWSEGALHEKLMKRHEQAIGYYDKSFYRNGEGSNPTYAIGYTFTVGRVQYHNHKYSKKIPTSPEGIVFYNPDDPNENELQPF